jgi:1-phosphatidylinositol-3-phosphate 5-kinase
MDDENCKECYDCKSVFSAWRRKHHCRICGSFIFLRADKYMCLYCSSLGQIFCSRCASNIIKGSRFGHDGMLRVCNLCMEKLAKVDEDDDDDRRSIVSSVTSFFPAHQLGVDSLRKLPQSPFAASQLFSRTDEPFNLYSIAETRHTRSASDLSILGSFSMRPGKQEKNGELAWDFLPENPAPFRRALSEEERDSEHISDPFANESPTSPRSKTPIGFPLIGGGTTSFIQFPVGSPDTDYPRPSSQLRGQFNSNAEMEVSTPFIRSRVQSRLDPISIGEPGWRTRRESTA